MINREIIYERNVTGSYMKIPADPEAGLDERLMLRRKMPGVLPVEKAYLDGGGQYWYNISGRQSLDTFCRVKELRMDMIEQLMIGICGTLERLDWNLIRTDCLMLDPELIFISNSSREFLFTLYPGGNHKLEQEFQLLMEYLIKKVDHKDAQAVRSVYRIYEQTLEEGYLMADIRNTLLQEKTAESQKEAESTQEDLEVQNIYADKNPVVEEDTAAEGKRSWLQAEYWLGLLREKLAAWGILQEMRQNPDTSKVRKRTKREKSDKFEEHIQIVYPDEEPAEIEEELPDVHPTVCLSDFQGLTRGVLQYLGEEGLSDIHLKDKTACIGYGQDADICINRETISQLHARIDRKEDGFYIEDLNSTNGTFVNDEALAYKQKRKLVTNDRIRFADVCYRFC